MKRIPLPEPDYGVEPIDETSAAARVGICLGLVVGVLVTLITLTTI